MIPLVQANKKLCIVVEREVWTGSSMSTMNQNQSLSNFFNVGAQMCLEDDPWQAQLTNMIQ